MQVVRQELGNGVVLKLENYRGAMSETREIFGNEENYSEDHPLN
jgi:hypothetical protein